MKVTVRGVSFDNLTINEAVREAFRGEETCRVVTPNALMLQACAENPRLAELLNESSLVLPDGNGVLLAARRQGTPLKERVAGIDFGERLLSEAARRGDRVFFLGGEDGVAPMAAKRMAERHPSLQVCGCYWGYFEKQGEENQRVVGMIRACRPQILLICMGFPTQELWMRENLPLLPSVRVAAGLGGSLDVWAGNARRAPHVLQSAGLEWAWRMLSNPSRLHNFPSLVRFWKGEINKK